MVFTFFDFSSCGMLSVIILVIVFATFFNPISVIILPALDEVIEALFSPDFSFPISMPSLIASVIKNFKALMFGSFLFLISSDHSESVPYSFCIDYMTLSVNASGNLSESVSRYVILSIKFIHLLFVQKILSMRY